MAMLVITIGYPQASTSWSSACLDATSMVKSFQFNQNSAAAESGLAIRKKIQSIPICICVSYAKILRK